MKRRKKVKRWLSGLVALIMMFAMTVANVSAEVYDSTGLDSDKQTGTVTLQVREEKKDSSKFTAYKVLDAKYIEGQDTYEYSYTEAFKDMAATYSLEKISQLVNGAEDHKIKADSADDFGTALEKFVKEHPGIEDEGKLLSNNSAYELELGYYLILETETTPNYKAMKPMLVAIPQQAAAGAKYEYDITVTAKDEPQTVEKTIEESEAAVKDSIAQQVGKNETFKLKSSVPVYNSNYTDIKYSISDTLSVGLEFVMDGDKPGVKVSTDEAQKNILSADKYDYTYDASNRTFTIDFSGDKFENVRNAEYVYVSYEATVTKDALIKDADGKLVVIDNKVKTTYTTTPGGNTGGKLDLTKNFIARLTLEKSAAEDAATKLQGAEFTIYTDEACENEAPLITYTVDGQGVITENKAENLSPTAVTDKNGVARFEGLGAGDYWIKETKAPDGYTLLKNPIKLHVDVKLPDKIESGEETATYTFTVDGNGASIKEQNGTEGSVTIDIKDAKGFTLPKTGGMGTYLFTIGGVAVMLAAAGVFFVSRRKSGVK